MINVIAILLVKIFEFLVIYFTYECFFFRYLFYIIIHFIRIFYFKNKALLSHYYPDHFFSEK